MTDTNVVKVFGMDTGKTIKAQKWYNFRLVIRAGDDAAADDKDRNYFWFYIDNQVIKEGFFKPTHDNGVQINCFTGFNYFWFYQYAFANSMPTEPTTFAERDLYLDNIKMESSTTTDCTLAPGTTNLNLTFAQAADDTWLSPQWLNGSGDSSGVGPDFKKHGTIKYQAGLGGKVSDDYVANVEIRDATTNNYNFWFHQWLNKDHGLADYGAKDYHIEFDFRSVNANTHNANLQGFYSGGSCYYLKFEGRNIIAPMDGNKQVGTYTPGEWLHIGLSMYPGTNCAKVYLDGELVYNGVLYPDSSKPLLRYKFEYNINSGKSDDLGIDNLVTTLGNRPNADYKQAAVASADTSKVKVDSANRVIKVKSDVTLENLKSILDTSGAALRVYINHDMIEKATELQNGCTAVVADGTTYQYFTIEEKATGTYTVDNFAFEMNGSEIEDGGAFSMGTLNAKASLTVFDANTKLSVIAAQYRENTDRLLQCVMSDTLVIDGVVDPFDGSPATVTASLSVTETEGTYIKAFLWDMRNGNIIPISSTAIQLAGATSSEIFDLALQYPGYTNKAVTFSFDDGRPEDKKSLMSFIPLMESAAHLT